MEKNRPSPPGGNDGEGAGEGSARKRLEAAYRERGGELVAWAARRTGSREDAEDLLQEAFLAGLRGMAGIERLADPMGWIFASLRNKAIDLWRKRERRGESGAGRAVSLEAIEEIVAATGLGPEAALERDELAEALADAIAALPREQRMVVDAQVLEGLTFRELSERTGIPIDTLTARKRYAVAKISRALSSWFGD